MVFLKNIGGYVKRIAFAAATVCTIYLTNIIGTGMIHNEFSEKITSQKRLEEVIKEERKKLSGCKGKSIDAAFITSRSEAISARRDDGSFYITVGGHTATRTAVRHELYHICRGHFKYANNYFVQFFYTEPTATLYQITGLKL